MTTLTNTDLVFDRADDLQSAHHEQVVFCRDRVTGLRAIIAIHDTRLGPALGGTRCYPYASEGDALRDALRLSQGMTNKAAVAGMALGGGKAVIIGDPSAVKSPELLSAYGRFVESLSGRYYTAADVGTTSDDLDQIATTTSYVVGTSSGSGDSGFSTAYGVFQAMNAAAELTWGASGIEGRRVGVEGVGKVGTHLVDLLITAGAQVVVADASDAALSAILQQVPEVEIRSSVLHEDLDVYAPCALGATLTHATVAALKAKVICGAANNQLLDPTVATALADRQITWVPDYVANAGGLIQVGGEIWSRTRDEVLRDVATIADTVTAILTRAADSNRLPGEVAAGIVNERLAAAEKRSEDLS